MLEPLEDFRDDAGEAIQPYYAAFMLEHGYRTGSDAWEAGGRSNYDFMVWVQARWAEYERRNGITNSENRRLYAGGFRAWLNDRAVDHLARYELEAA